MDTIQSSQSIDMSQFTSQCVDPSDLSSYFDFNDMNSPTIGNGKARMTQPQAPSTLTSPASALSHDLSDDQLSLLRPSHDYSRFKQQTGLPTQASHAMVFPGYNSSIYDSGSSSSWGDMGAGSSIDAFLDMSDEIIDPMAIMKQEEAQAHMRYFPGMHQQQALQAKQKQQEAAQKLQNQRQASSSSSRRSGSSQPLDPMTEQTIARVMSDIRRNSSMAADSMSPSNSGVHPHIIRAKKDEDDMDEDERLLNSEEGKKLSSKERRQLRNKVSARAFRSRRKEYIGQLEGEINAKSNETAELKRQNHLLIEENARFRILAEKLLAHPAFHPFLDELSRDPELADSLSKVTNSSAMSNPAPQIPKDIDPFATSQMNFLPQQNDNTIGMTMVGDMSMDLSSLNIGSNNGSWSNQHGNMGTFQPQVFAVTEISVGPVEPLDIEALSGKASSSILSEYDEVIDEESKSVTPIISSVEAKADSVKHIVAAKSTEATAEESVFDENDPAFTLYATSSTPSSSPVSDYEPIFGEIAPEKVFAHFELFVSSEEDNEQLMNQFERMTSRLEAQCRRLEALTAGY